MTAVFPESSGDSRFAVANMVFPAEASFSLFARGLKPTDWMSAIDNLKNNYRTAPLTCAYRSASRNEVDSFRLSTKVHLKLGPFSCVSRKFVVGLFRLHFASRTFLPQSCRLTSTQSSTVCTCMMNLDCKPMQKYYKLHVSLSFQLSPS